MGRDTRGHAWVVVVVTIMALAVGWVSGTSIRGIGDQKSKPAGQTTQGVINFLSQPLPVPAGAKELKLAHSGILRQGGGDGTVTWRKGVVLDVTGMTPKDIADIPTNYLAHFSRQFPYGSQGYGNHEDLCRIDDEFTTAFHADWTWRWIAENRGDDFDLNMDVEIMDFDRITPGSSRYSRLPVMELDNPVRGQRIMWIRFDFQGRNLTGPGKWPDF